MKNSVVSKGRYYEVMLDYNTKREEKIKEIDELRGKANKALAAAVRCREVGISDREVGKKYLDYLEQIEVMEKELREIKRPDGYMVELAIMIDNAPVENQQYDIAMKIIDKYKELEELQKQALDLEDKKIGSSKDSILYHPIWLKKAMISSRIFLQGIEHERTIGNLMRCNAKDYEKKLNEYLEKKEQERKKRQEVYGDILKDLE